MPELPSERERKKGILASGTSREAGTGPKGESLIHPTPRRLKGEDVAELSTIDRVREVRPREYDDKAQGIERQFDKAAKSHESLAEVVRHRVRLQRHLHYLEKALSGKDLTAVQASRLVRNLLSTAPEPLTRSIKTLPAGREDTSKLLGWIKEAKQINGKAFSREQKELDSLEEEQKSLIGQYQDLIQRFQPSGTGWPAGFKDMKERFSQEQQNRLKPVSRDHLISAVEEETLRQLGREIVTSVAREIAPSLGLDLSAMGAGTMLKIATDAVRDVLDELYKEHDINAYVHT